MRVLVSLLFVFSLGCGAAQKKIDAAVAAATGGTAPPAPSSARSGSGNDDWTKKPRPGCTKGSAPMAPYMESAAEMQAANMARAELALQLKAKVKVAVETTQEIQTSDKKMSSQQQLDNVVRSVANEVIPGSRIEDTRNKGDMKWVLVCLDPEALADALNKISQIGPAQRTELREWAEGKQSRLDELTAE